MKIEAIRSVTATVIIVIALYSQPTTAFSIENYRSKIVDTIPWGKADDQVGIIRGEEERISVGPPSFTVDENGSLYILDCINSKVHKKKGLRQSTQKETINIQLDECAYDIVVDPEENIDLIKSDKIFFLDRNGIKTDEFDIPNNIEFIKNIFPSDNGVVFYGKNNNIYRANRHDLYAIHPVNSIEKINGDDFCNFITKKIGDNFSIININTGENFAIRHESHVASVKFINCDDYGNLYVVIETITQDTSISVTKEIGKYSPQGSLLFIGKLDINYYTHPNKDVMVTKEGTIYQMQPTADGVLIRAWEPQNITGDN